MIKNKIKKYIYSNRPEMGTESEWNKWKKEAKKNKIRWFLFETFPLWFKATFIWSVERVKDWFSYRYIKDYRIIKAHSLKPGYYDKDTLIVHGMFDLLVDFVEIEKAWMEWCFVELDKMSWWKRKITRFKKSRELGFKHLDWEISLINPNSEHFDKQSYTENFLKQYGSLEEFKKHEDYKKTQSAIAQEIKDLYIWWKDIYQTRPDSIDVKGDLGYSWSEYCDMMHKKNPDDFFFENKTEEEKKICDSSLKASRETEEKYEKENTEMLIRLIKIRRSLWT
jgi:hypothetical protein